MEGTATRREFDVIIIGAGITGVGLYWDLVLRGFRVLLLDKAFPTAGTSGRYHGLLHSGARYAVVDPEAAVESARENRLLRHLFPGHVARTGGYFLQMAGDGDEYVRQWEKACHSLRIPASEVEPAGVRREEPLVHPSIRRAFRVKDGTIDAFTLTQELIEAGRQLGGVARPGKKVTAVLKNQGRVEGVQTEDGLSGERESIVAPVVVNAAGPWASRVAQLAGIILPLTLDRGTLLVFSRRLNRAVLNRLRPPADGDIFVPHGHVTIFGTTSQIVSNPEDLSPRRDEIAYLLRLGSALIPDLGSFRLLRAFTGIRPLYGAEGNSVSESTPATQPAYRGEFAATHEGAASFGLGQREELGIPVVSGGRGMSRSFGLLDHGQEGAEGFFSLVGGKLTTFRLMAEKAGDVVARRLGRSRPGRTAATPLTEVIQRRGRVGAGRRAAALSEEVTQPTEPVEVSRRAMLQPGMDEETTRDFSGEEIICECEGVTWGRVREAFLAGAKDLSDLRRVTRLGMGPCQGTRCSLRAVGFLTEAGLLSGEEGMARLSTFLAERWRGQEPVAWGSQLRQMELFRGIYEGLLGLDLTEMVEGNPEPPHG